MTTPVRFSLTGLTLLPFAYLVAMFWGMFKETWPFISYGYTTPSVILLRDLLGSLGRGGVFFLDLVAFTLVLVFGMLVIRLALGKQAVAKLLGAAAGLFAATWIVLWAVGIIGLGFPGPQH